MGVLDPGDPGALRDPAGASSRLRGVALPPAQALGGGEGRASLPYAAGDGVVEYAGRNGGYGKYVRLRHGNNYKTAYAHMRRYGHDIRMIWNETGHRSAAACSTRLL